MWQPGVIAAVAGPGYPVAQLAKDGFKPAEFSLGVADVDQVVYLKEAAIGEELNLPPGHLMVIAGTIRPLPAALLNGGRDGAGRMRR